MVKKKQVRVRITGPSGKRIFRTLDGPLESIRVKAKRIFGKKVVVSQVPLMRKRKKK